jgi:two-component system, NarL family, nitrate/nitrite response regulator NarL
MSVRVLIVENNTVARGFLARVVRESFSDEISFVEVQDLDAARRMLGLQAGQRARPERVDFQLILVDLEEPDGSGLELLAQLADVPAIKIATTLHSDDEFLFPSLQCGASGYLLKEDRFAVLVEELQKIVRGQPSLSPAIARRLLGFFRGHDGSGRVTGFDSGFAGLSDFAGRTVPGSLGGPDGPSLTGRETEALVYLSKGFTIKEIARLMGVKWFAIHELIRSVYRKLAQHSSPEEALALSRQSQG